MALGLGWAGLGEQNVVNIKFRHRLSVKQMHAKSVALFNRCAAAADSITHTYMGIANFYP